MKFKLVTTSCRRCGKALMTGNRSLYGNDEAKARLDRICQACITPEEQREIDLATCPINRPQHGDTTS